MTHGRPGVRHRREVTDVAAGRPALGGGCAEVLLSGLVEALGGYLEVISAPRGAEIPVNGPIIYDEDPPEDLAPADLLLAVGVHVDSPGARELVRVAGRAAASAVVFRKDGEVPGEAVYAADQAGVAILAVPCGTSWGQLFTLIVTALEAERAATWNSEAGLAVGDLVQLANAIAGTVGGATTIEDPDSNVLAFSSLGHPIDTPRRDTILGHRIPGAWRLALEERGVFKELYASDDVLRIDGVRIGDLELTPRMAIVVRAGGEVLGSVWVAQAERPFDGDAVQALRGAARIAALHMLHHRAAGDLDRQRRIEQMRALLSGQPLPPPGLALLGLSAGTPLTVVAVAPDIESLAEPEIATARMLSVITLYAEVFRRRAAAVAVDGVVYVILPAVEEADRSRLMVFVKDLVVRAGATIKSTVIAGVGTTATDLAEVLSSRREADDVVRVMPRLRNPCPAAHIDDVRGHVALMHLADFAAQESHLRGGKVQRLVVHDERHDTRYVETLQCYLDRFGDIPAAAASLSIHRNTFRYRLARLLEISGLDLDDPDERLVTHLQLGFMSRGARG
jgi:hypothetical protein